MRKQRTHLINPMMAVQELRAHLGDSQQAFATRLKLSIRAIANYEKDRIPSIGILEKLVSVARTAGRDDLSDVFVTALGRELGLENSEMAMLFGDLGGDGKEPSAYLLLSVKGQEPAEFLRSFYRVMMLYLYGGKETKTTAERVLRDFKDNATKSMRGAK